METITTLTLPTHELQAGDIVHLYGMRIRLDTLRTYHGGTHHRATAYYAEHCSQGHGITGTDSCSVVYRWSGTVLNVADAHIIPRAWLYDNERHVHGPGHGREDHWTVQGNFRATWEVERL